VDDLVLSAEGLGPLRLGQEVDREPSTRMVTFDPLACTDAVTGEDRGVTADDPFAGIWIPDPLYATDSAAYGPGYAFGMSATAEGLVERIDLYSSDISTDGGIRIGDPGEAVQGAHPSARVEAAPLTDIYVVEGRQGILQIEVARDSPDAADYWEGETGRVVYIHAVVPSAGVFSVAASGNLVGVCGA
jgi:hypothetical protein